jgi:hypothetical protein
VSSYRVFFPGRTYSPTDITAALTQHSIDATLVIAPRASGEEVTYVPPSYVTSCSSGWTSQGGCTEVTTSPASSGTSVRKPWLTTSAMMFDARTAQSVWVASGFTGGNAYATSHTLLASVVERIHASLESDEVTDRQGCFLSNRTTLLAGYQSQVALEARGNYFRSLQAVPDLPYTLRERRERTDSINAAREANRREAAQQLPTLPTVEEVQFAKQAIADLSSCPQ